jgi:hypothetical protein
MFEAVRRPLGVTHRVLNVPEIGLHGARVVPRVREGEAAGVLRLPILSVLSHCVHDEHQRRAAERW